MSTAACVTLDRQQQEKRNRLLKRLFQTCLDALDIFSVYLGHHLGYYATLRDSRPLTSAELAAAAGTHERYAREWLEQQAATGILEVEDHLVDAPRRRYRLDPGHAEVLADRDSLYYFVPLIRYFVATGPLIPEILKAHRTGRGISWPRMGDEIREAQEGFNRALFLKQLGSEALARIPDVHARLQAEPAPRVADIGCGSGWSSIAMARAYPNVQVDGFDYDGAAVETARRNAADFGVSERVQFHTCSAGEAKLDAICDVVTFFECLHDLARPVDALRTAHRLLAPGGSVIIMDERVAEHFAAPADYVDRMMYGWSLLQCLPGGMEGEGSAGTGAVMRPATLQRYAEQAGFRSLEILPIDHDPLRRWYRLRP
jgi:2-polyprenyl-3-methyl-5-hydroxy-6-metoxy-1,4-benzoquinol methylase